MTFLKTSRLVVFLLLILILTACDNTTPTPQNLPYNPGCSVPNLIGHINQANGNPGPDVINLDPHCFYILTAVDNSTTINNHVIHNGLPVISSEITINGNMAIIDIQRAPGEPGFGHFYVNPTGDLELYDLTLSNGIRQLGGAVIVYEGDFFASSSYFFDNGVGPMDMENPAPGLGGAIYNESGRVRIIKNSLFRRNYASQPNIQGGDLGGAIYNKNGILTVSSTIFGSNSAAGSGGAIYSEKDASDESGGLVIIDGSTFTNNSAVQDGGAISLINETNGVFITTSDFYENQADESGGAIFSEASDLTANYEYFEGNAAALGGAIYSKRLTEGSLSSLTSKNTIFNHNTASEIGGAIFSENSDVTLDRIISLNNTANSCGVFRNGGSPSLVIAEEELETTPSISSESKITKSFLLNNLALLSHGGAVCHVMGELSIQDTRISNNRAISMGGGLLLLDDSELTGLIVSGNEAEQGGGATIGYPWMISSNRPVNTTISNSSFIDNQASNHGGGLWADHAGWVRISKSTFSSNTSEGKGGGIYQFAGNLYITNSTFSGNSAEKGGGLYAFGTLTSNPRLEIKHSTFAYNTATETSGDEHNRRWGGGGVNLGGDVTLTNSLITQNTSIDCQLDNGQFSTFSFSGMVDSTGDCGPFLTEPNPMIGPLTNNGGSTATHSLLPGSPLIDILNDCAGLNDDQRGVGRPINNCDPGSYEFDPDNPPEEWPWEEISLTPEPDDSSDNCLPFEDLDISVVLLSVPAETLVLPLYLKIPGGVPGMEGSELWEYRALLGEFESYQCGLQGFPDRLYCMFTLPSEALGLALDLKLFIGNCEDPAYYQPKVTIPLPKCNADLGEEACKVAGGTWKRPLTGGDYYCDCP